MGVVERIQLKLETLNGFNEYIAGAESAMVQAATSPEFLWCDRKPERVQQVREGAIIAEYSAEGNSKAPVEVLDGLIHDWVGAAFIPDRTVGQALALVQDYVNHKNIYRPEVVESGVLSHNEDRFQIHLRLLKKKIVSVVLDTYHDVLYSSFPLTSRALCFSRSTQIIEVQNAGTPHELKLPPDFGYGFLWRLYSYWRFQEKDGGTFVECRAISLSRDVPAVLAWAINPIVRKLPKESLIHTLAATKQGVLADRQTEAHSVALEGFPDASTP